MPFVGDQSALTSIDVNVPHRAKGRVAAPCNIGPKTPHRAAIFFYKTSLICGDHVAHMLYQPSSCFAPRKRLIN